MLWSAGAGDMAQGSGTGAEMADERSVPVGVPHSSGAEHVQQMQTVEDQELINRQVGHEGDGLGDTGRAALSTEDGVVESMGGGVPVTDPAAGTTQQKSAHSDLFDLPLRKVTAAQLDNEAFVTSFVFMVQDVWHSEERIIRKLPRDHSNYTAICQEIRRAYSICLPKQCGLLLGTTVQQLQQSIAAAADNLRGNLRAIASKYTAMIHTDSLSAVDKLMSQIESGEEVPHAASDHDLHAQEGSGTATTAGSASREAWNRDRKVLEVGWEGCDNAQARTCNILNVCLSDYIHTCHVCPHTSR